LALNESSPEKVKRAKRPRKASEARANVLAPSSSILAEAFLRELVCALSTAAEGDFSVRLRVPGVRGSGRDLAVAFNALVARNEALEHETLRIEREVGREGRLRVRMSLGTNESGGWAASAHAINALIGDLTRPTIEVARVIGAVAAGDLSQKMKLDIDGQALRGEFLEIGMTVNSMVDQLNSFASEVTRVAKEVGTEGKLGGQAEVTGVSGTWKDLTDNVNSMASNLTAQVRNIALVTTAVANGDLSKKITVDVRGEILELKNTINTMVDQLNSFASEVTRVAKEVGTEGKLGGQAEVTGVAGVWKNLTDNVNFMARNLTTQVRGIVKVVTAVANGDLKQKLVVDAKGEVAALADTINNMTDTLGTFADQVSTVAREVGIEGKLGGQARVPGVAGTWRDLTENVNFMASNLTTQVRGLVKVVTAVANGDLSKKLVGVEAKGEIAALADTINSMCDTLGTFADQVSTVAREVGIEGKLGGQAKVPGATGTWRQLTDNVNQLAANLTSQVRAISEVATAVTKGDLTRSIDVQAEGEVALLKDNINQMIRNLRETTEKNTEQDWLKTNLARFSSMMQGQKNLQTVSEMIMSELTPLVSAHHGAFFMMDAQADVPALALTSTYAYRERKTVANRFRIGEGLVGQCAREKKGILLTRVPPDYIQINSGLGEAPPLNILVLPVLFEGEVKAVVELASFHPFSDIHQLFLDQLTVSIGVVLNMITASMRTEQLLLQSQGLTQELQSQSQELQVQRDELRRTNLALEKQAIELEEKARLLAQQNEKVEIKNSEVEQARTSLEEKAEQLALASNYKSEFLANMSHELRTPLNSLLILARLLADNQQSNLTPEQVQYAETIYSSGADLLSLINEILDLSKVEAGKMHIEPRAVLVSEIAQSLRRSFQPVAEQRGLTFESHVVTGTSETIWTDPQRLQQVLKNLLSNAFKFTEEGTVALRITDHVERSSLTNETLATSRRVMAFEVSDTGIGIPEDKQRLIFEAFQQADGTTSRQYGGTGLGLSISRKIAGLLGGEIQLESAPGKGSRFTLFLPDDGGEARSARPTARRWTTAPEADPAYDRPEAVALARALFEDDRTAIVPGDRVLLVIEDDEAFAKILLLVGRQTGFKVVVATRGDTGLALAAQVRPNAVTLDVELPVVDGWSVLERLKSSPSTRHIPVQVISVREREHLGTSPGVFAYLVKPVTKDALEGALARLREYVDRPVGANPRATVLVVDDDVRNTFALSSVLETKGIRVIYAENGEAGMAVLEREKAIDAVLMDIMMPQKDGYETIREIRRNPRHGRLPIIAVTAKALPEDGVRCMQAGADAYVAKPIDGDALIERIDTLVAGRETPRSTV
jgi:signal transduction histidine kinase/CheY-like chemotaxis protein/HAMP domain-containing protein